MRMPCGVTPDLATCVAGGLRRRGSPARRPRPPIRSRAGRKGSATAPITVYEMSDFQCPYCRRFALETFPTLEREYIATGKVRWVFVNFPLTTHPLERGAGGARSRLRRPSRARSGRCTTCSTSTRRPGRRSRSRRRSSSPSPTRRRSRSPRCWSACSAPATGRRSAEARGGRAVGRAEHADVLHRGRTAGRRAPAAGVPAGARFDLSREGQEVRRVRLAPPRAIRPHVVQRVGPRGDARIPGSGRAR